MTSKHENTAVKVLHVLSVDGEDGEARHGAARPPRGGGGVGGHLSRDVCGAPRITRSPTSTTLPSRLSSASRLGPSIARDRRPCARVRARTPAGYP